MHFQAVLALTVAGALRIVPAAPMVLGRCPLDRVVKMVSGHFVSRETPSLLVVQDIGRAELSRVSRPARVSVSLTRLGVIHHEAEGFYLVWVSEPIANPGCPELGLSGTAWTAGDFDDDGLDELLLLGSGECRLLNFERGEVTDETLVFPSRAVVSAAVCDVNDDGAKDVVTIEVPYPAEGSSTYLIQVYQRAGPGLAPRHPYSIGFNWGTATRVALLGSARLEDYPGVLPVLVGVRAELRPSTYAILYEPRPDSLILTTNPFPWQEWFSKTQTLPAGELTIFNVEDTLVGYGYFVPGSRPSGPPMSFAALQDGEWRLLALTNSAARLTGLVSRFRCATTDGWLELRDNLFYFYAGDIFRWR